MNNDSIGEVIAFLRADAPEALGPLLDALGASEGDDAGIEEAWRKILKAALDET